MRRRSFSTVALAGLGASLCGPLSTSASGAEQAAHDLALIIGVNRSPSPDLAPLRYADDDALRYEELFRALGARAIVLASPDESTRRLHPESAAQARPATLVGLRAAVAELAGEAQRARARGERVRLYFLYAGHGERDELTEAGTLTLEDGPLPAHRLKKDVLGVVDASEYHLIIDACNAEYLVAARGPGGQRRALPGFVHDVAVTLRDPRVGLVYASSPQARTFEYEGFQAGVFSHLVRSALYGAGDFDQDGRIGYEELQKFVALAAAAVPNEKYRPTVHALRPAVTRSVLDIRAGLAARRLEVGPDTPAARHALEDARGVRILDFHNGPGQPLRLVRSAGTQFLLVEPPGQPAELEYELPARDGPITLAELSPRPRTVAARGAADSALRMLFQLPFSAGSLSELRVPDHDYQDVLAEIDREERTDVLARRARWAKLLAGAAVVTAGVAAGTGITAMSLSNRDGASLSQRDIAAQNERIRDFRTASLLSGGAAATLLAGALALWLWPEPEARATLSPSEDSR